MNGSMRSLRSRHPRTVPASTDTTIPELILKNRASELDTLCGKALATAWSQLNDPAVKAEAWADMRSLWQDKGWWDEEQKGTAN